MELADLEGSALKGADLRAMRDAEVTDTEIRTMGIEIGTVGKPLRAKTVSYVSGIIRNPCIRYGPNWNWRTAPGDDDNYVSAIAL